MLVIYHSNNLELFMRLVINIMSSYRISNLMKPEIILIENKITEKWIEIELSDHFGISANIVFMSIRSFIQKIFKEMLPIDLNKYDFSYDSMYWKFMSILPKSCTSNNCSIIQKYLYNDINQRKCGQLSMAVTSLFLEYLIYRSDWLNVWKADKVINNLKDTEHQLWQSEIWRMFLERNENDIFKKYNPLDYYLVSLQNNDQQLNYNNLPKRIFIYSVTSIPIIYWKILNLLSYQMDIYLWMMMPIIGYRHCYFDNKIQYLQQKKDVLCDNDICKSLEYYREQYNLPLLNLWNSLIQDTSYLLNKSKNFFVIKAFSMPRKNSMLHILQKDFLKSQLNHSVINLQRDLFDSSSIKINRKRYILDSKDQSITIHQCHYIQREIEVLHNNLLSMLSNNSSLLPGDIIVMAPDISCYKSAIKNTFNNLFNRKLPFSISASFKHMYPIISSVFKILDFWCSRFTSEEVLSFLSISSILSRFNISIKEVEVIRIWIIESGIRWGLDQDTMKIFDVPVTDQNTWFFGLKRILLGYAMNNQNKLWKNIYPYDYVNEEYITIISKLGNFFNTLKKWRDRLHRIYTLKEWMPYMQEIIDDFFDCTGISEEENRILFLLKKYWINILESGIQSGYLNKIGIVILRDQLKFKLNKKSIDCRFLPNVINFCDIVPICCVPCKVLCIIGMNNDAFPRKLSLCDFNLILKEKRYCDNNIRNKDCYEFLLTCLLPKERLYLSFIKKIDLHPNDNIEYSSILIDEILDYIARNFYLIGNQNLDVINNKKSLRNYLLRNYSYTPFDCNNFITNTQKQSFAKEWLNAANIINSDIDDVVYFNKFSVLLPEITITAIFFRDLYNFYRHPIRTWFQKRLGVYFHLNTYNRLINDEPFFVDNIDRFVLNTKLVDYIIHNKNTNELYQESYAAGMIPYGSFGKLYWCNQYERMNKLANQIKMFYSNHVFQLDIDLEFNNIRLIGKLSLVQKNGLIRWKAAHLNMKDCLLFWLEHLIYCSIGGKGESRLFGINNIWHLPNFSGTTAKKLLFILIAGYCSGMNNPLMLLYRSGGIWINYMFDWNSKTISVDTVRQDRARQRLIQEWQGQGNSTFSKGEYCDPYLRKLIPFYLNKTDINRIISISKDYLLNVMQYRIL